jgi:hypothetical protein
MTRSGLWVAGFWIGVFADGPDAGPVALVLALALPLAQSVDNIGILAYQRHAVKDLFPNYGVETTGPNG